MNSLEISQNSPKSINNISNNVSNGGPTRNLSLSDSHRTAAQSVTRRTRLPHQMVESESQLAGFLRNNIGKVGIPRWQLFRHLSEVHQDLSKVTFPVTFNEPISILQR
jgi:hypothetical protein